MSIIDEIAQSILAIGEASEESLAVKRFNELIKGTRLHGLTQDIRAYLKKQRGVIRKKHLVRFQQYLLLMKVYIDVADHVGRKWRNSANKESTKYRINTSSKLFFKSIQICLDLLTLMENGSLTSSLSIWRNIYENYVVSLFLLSHDETISRRFNDHQVVDLLTIVEDVRQKAKYDEKMNTLVAEYGDHFIETYGWAYETGQKRIKTFHALRRIVDEKEFHGYYKLTSNLLHASSLSVNRSFFSDGEHGNINMIGIFDRNLHLPYRLTVQLMKTFSNVLVDYFYDDDDFEKNVVTSVTNIVSDFAIGSDRNHGK